MAPAVGEIDTRTMNSGDAELLRALIRVGPRLLAEIAFSLLLGRRRSLAADAARVVHMISPPPRVEGHERIPATGPFLMAGNHFQATRLWVGWVVVAITHAIAQARRAGGGELHWIIAAEWGKEVGGRWVRNPLTSFVFPRAAATWALVSMPLDPSNVRGRARALRQALGYLGRGSGKGHSPEPAGILPEGMATVALGEARPGSGAFMSRVSRLGIPILPVGTHEEEGRLVIRFGEPLFLGRPPANSSLDDWARLEVMTSIGRLLPPKLWGAYASRIDTPRPVR